LGTVLASAACFGVFAWFLLALQTGVIENPKPHQASMDAAKPALLWGQAIIALIAGIWLSFLAFIKSKSHEVLELGPHNEVNRYGRVSRVLHWTTAILFMFLIPTGIFSSMIPEGAWYRTEYNVVHKTIGIIVSMLFVARIIWNRMSLRPALDNSLKPVERKMAHAAHIVLYGLLIAIPVTGYVMTSLHGYSTYFFVIEIPPVLAKSNAYIYWGAVHKYLLQYLVYIVLGAHILGALKHQFMDKHKNAFKRMVG
jgi:cytochrome b561